MGINPFNFIAEDVEDVQRDTPFMSGNTVYADQAGFLSFMEMFDQRGRSVSTAEDMKHCLSSIAEETGMNGTNMYRVAQYALKVGKISRDQFDLIEKALYTATQENTLVETYRDSVRRKINEIKLSQLDCQIREALPDPDTEDTTGFTTGHSTDDTVDRDELNTGDFEPGGEAEIGAEAGDQASPEAGDEGSAPSTASMGDPDRPVGEGPGVDGGNPGEIEPATSVEDKPEGAGRPAEIEFIGGKEAMGLNYALQRKFNAEGDVQDLIIVNQLGEPVVWASKEGLDVADVGGFIIFAKDKLEMDNITSTIIDKYDLFGVKKAQEEKEHENEDGGEEALPGEMALPKAPLKPGDFGYPGEHAPAMGEGVEHVKHGRAVCKQDSNIEGMGIKFSRGEKYSWELHDSGRERLFTVFVGQKSSEDPEHTWQVTPKTFHRYFEIEPASVAEAVVEAAAKASPGGDWKSVLDQNGIDPDYRFRGGENRIYFRCQDPGLAQTVAAQLGAHIDGDVDFEGLKFVRVVLEGCAGESPEVKKWKAIHKNMTKPEIRAAARKAARTRANENNEEVPSEWEVAVVLLTGQIANELDMRDNGPSFSGQELTDVIPAEIPTWDAIVDEFVANNGESLKQLLASLKPGQDWVEHVMGVDSRAADAAYDQAAAIVDEYFKDAGGHVTETSKIVASGIADQSIAQQIAASKHGEVVADAEDKSKWMVIAKEEAKL